MEKVNNIIIKEYFVLKENIQKEKEKEKEKNIFMMVNLKEYLKMEINGRVKNMMKMEMFYMN